MTFPDLPRPLTTDHKLLVGLAVRLEAQNELLARILDRLPEPPSTDDGQTVELREPIRQDAGEQAEAPKPPPARRPRKTTPKGATPSKEKP